MLKLAYLVVCDEFKVVETEIDDNVDLSLIKVFDRREIKTFPHTLDNISVVAGLLGEEADDQEEFYFRVRGKKVAFSTSPYTYRFKDYDEIHVYHSELDNFPLDESQTIYFEVVYKNKVIGMYPVRFNCKEDN
ncbi:MULTISPECIES: hypothetical protein [unclassified Paenibacillus]|uniref:hypothetical protein n=1 Tax=Paenibacillus TaxID=44249 RepID=UPI000CFE1C4A|nr:MULTISPECIES: hypothetical protein [unclassified Paenibacillus]PRA08075.1 hypothetical protein CQ043_12155 [Paenibacillus sp. MYb63]PRA47847.1 hypothetical protein CQ061_14675 [Paenibacillus sp. MYb67]